MTKKQLSTGIAVSVSLAIVAFFFIFSNVASMGSAQKMSASDAGSLVVQDEAIGTGAAASAGDVVTVNYTGKFQNGTIFDTSIGRAPFQFTLGIGQVIPGWDQGLQGMKVGGKRLLIIPPGLAYGAAGAGPIPPNSTLIFEVDLIGIQSQGTMPAVPEGSSAN